MIESCGPVMPASVRHAVPLGRIRSSAVWTWVCVPTTAVTRPSRCQPIAIFSEVASAWKSTKINLRLGAKRFDFAERERERIVEWRHEDAPHQIQYTDRLAGASAPDDAAASRHAGREVRGPQEPRLARQILQHLFLVPDVVARRHDVDAIAEDRIRHVAGDAETRRRVLDVGDDEIESALLDERRNRAPGDLAAGFSKDVADEQDLHQGPEKECTARW